MNEISGKKKIINSLMWKYLERGSVQGVSFIVSIILARLLAPSDYGLIVIITIFINIANVFVQSSFNMALIQKKDINDKDYSSVLYISMAVAIILYFVLYFSSPIIAAFYNNTKIIQVIRVLALMLPFGALNSVQNALLIRNMDFKKIFKIGFIAAFFSGIIGISLAFLGAGVWALVGQQLTNAIFVCLIMWFTIKWRPLFSISFGRIKVLFSFGWKILVSALIDTTYDQLYNIVVGKLYSSSQLAYFNKGQEFPRFIVINIDSSIESVMLPIYAKYQTKREALKSILRKAITVSSYIVFPILFGLFGAAQSVVSVILTDKWNSSVPFVQVYCLALLFHPINIANVQAINAMGRSDITLKINIVKKISAICILVFSIFFGLKGIATGAIINGFIFVALNTNPNRVLLNYGIVEQFKDIFPALFLSMLMGGVVWSISLVEINNLLKLIIQILVGIFTYWLLSVVTKNKTYQYLKSLVKELLQVRRRNA